jgi:tetratricopeptide (TPR) repeat protein
MPTPDPDELLQQAVAHLNAGRQDLCDVACAEIFASFPDHPEANYVRGVAACDQGDDVEGIERLERCAAAAPGEARYNAALCDIYFALSDYARAIPRLEAALAFEPDASTFRKLLGDALVAVDRPAEAVPHYEHVVAAEPDDVDARVALGTALHRSGELDRAEAALQRAVACAPDHPPANGRMGLLLLERGDTAAGRNHLERAVTAGVADAEVHERLGDLLRSEDCFEEALVYYQCAVEQRASLMDLAQRFRTDKWLSHYYARHYQKHFLPRRLAALNLLEIGVGGYGNPRGGGASLRMWKAFFPNARIFSLDINDKSAVEEERIRIFHGSQDDPEFLRHVAAEIGRLDIIIDDGSHINQHVITAFETLFPLLADDGIYAVEDTQTSYWPSYGGSSEDLEKTGTMHTLFKRLTDGLNYEERLIPGYEPSYFDRHIVAMHFYHNLVFIYKGENDEGSNFVTDGVLTMADGN